MRFIITGIVILMLGAGFSCSREKSTSQYCKEFAQGKTEHIGILVSRKARGCFQEHLSHPLPAVREHSIKGFSETHSTGDYSSLHNAVADNYYSVSLAAARILAKTEIPEHIQPVINGLSSRKAPIRRACIYALLESKNKKYMVKIAGLLNDASPEVRMASALYLTAFSAVEHLNLLKQSLSGETDTHTYNVKTRCIKILQDLNGNNDNR